MHCVASKRLMASLSSRDTAAKLPALKQRTIALARKSNFAHFVRDARLRRGLSTAEVAEQIGVSQSSIYFWESDYCRPRDANLTALCKALRLPLRATREMAAG